MRIGFIGCGAIFSHYASIIKDKIEGMEIVAICDTDESKRSIAQKIVTANFYDNVQNMIDSEKMDACFILSPSGIHYEHGKVCLESGVNTFIEKPIALKIDHAIELNELAKKQKVALGVIYQNRFNKAIQFAKKLIDKNLLGKRILTNVRLLWSRDNEYYKGWRGTWEMDGGVMAQQAIHHLDILQWLNSPVKKVYCIEQTMINKLEAEDTSIGTILFEDGSMGSFQVTTATRPNDLEASITILGENGNIEIGGLALNMIKDINIKGFEDNKGKFIKENSEHVDKGFGNGHISYLKSIYDSFSSGKIVPPVSGDEAIHSLRLVQGLYMSSENDSPVNFQNDIRSKRLGIS